ncbi:phosphatidylserine decarboxylase [Ruminococcaceae bacterium YRB3002]|nr:phosphatidylserine decarboxylase [Ruminococcaceae bacterium YRB3002]
MTALEFLYRTGFGRLLLKPMASRGLSRLCGAFLDTCLSKPLISSFVRNNNIIEDDYVLDGINSFNDFFCRRIKDGLRVVDDDPNVLVAPCDGLLTVYSINADTVVPVKQSSYTISSLLRDEKLAAGLNGGLCLVFRLCVDHYHRYSYVDSGSKSANVFIPGVLHTVRPVALAERPVFVENCREYCVIDSPNFGRMVQMEVGAMLVGKIVNEDKGASEVVRGAEKGHFEYGGSTIIVLVPAGTAVIRDDIYDASLEGVEIPVKLGEEVGRSLG